MLDTPMPEIIYILTNPVMPDLVKIGKTSNLEERIRSLSAHTGVPIPFEVFYACEVVDANKIERHLHDGFGDHRINPRREFFRINPERVLSILQLLAIREVTPGEDFVNDAEEQQALVKERERRESFRFSLVGIQPGATLRFVRDEEITAIVLNDKQVEFEGAATSLSAAAGKILTRNYDWVTSKVQGPLYWVYENKTLSERRVELETEN